MTSHDLVKLAPSWLYRKRDGIGQTPCSYERYLVVLMLNVYASLFSTINFRYYYVIEIYCFTVAILSLKILWSWHWPLWVMWRHMTMGFVMCGLLQVFIESAPQSKSIIAPYVASESEARVGGARRSVHVHCKQCQTVLSLNVAWKYWEVQQIYSCMTVNSSLTGRWRKTLSPIMLATFVVQQQFTLTHLYCMFAFHKLSQAYSHSRLS